MPGTPPTNGDAPGAFVSAAGQALRGFDPARAVCVEPMRVRRRFLAANSGVRLHGPGFTMLVHPRGDDSATIGFGVTVTRKVGTAVVRNRIKRRFRALARAHLAARGIAGTDVVMIGRDGADRMPFSLIQDGWLAALTAAPGKLSRHDPNRPRRPRPPGKRSGGR